MNWLAHLHLGGNEPEQLLGSLYGDFVKGALNGRFSPGIEAGIALHRAIDQLTDTHPLFAVSRARFPGEQRRVAGILLDLFFDHCLARDWSQYSAEPLPRFTARVYRLLRQAELPARLRVIAPRMAAQDWLGSYRDFAVLERALEDMARRLSRPELFRGAFLALERLYPKLSADFAEVYPQLQAFAARQANQPASAPACTKSSSGCG
ncbi:ACP phosphodiesterase [Ventosimonas gracilis]|uniref:ACP phosphodiesterase n=1 Tax=Ventosimonas gracilis TaxID=1680762 RepID=A0A139SWV3_9GAMM|nr:ACP phosphodiesterase [Ventosimonas gracilis]KXU39079.1 ACP phosphodiesterase [Ventosimonas gracilis]